MTKKTATKNGVFGEFEIERVKGAWWSDTRGNRYPWTNVGPAFSIAGIKRLLKRRLREEARKPEGLEGHDDHVLEVKKVSVKLP